MLKDFFRNYFGFKTFISKDIESTKLGHKTNFPNFLFTIFKVFLQIKEIWNSWQQPTGISQVHFYYIYTCGGRGVYAYISVVYLLKFEA